MRLVTLKLTGYRQFLEPTILHFPEGLSGICGPNGVGKSKLIEAIGYALYGAASPVLPKGDKVTDLPSRAWLTGKAPACVELLLEVRGQFYEIVRSPHITTLRLKGSAEPLAVGARAVTTKVIELLRLSPAAYYGTFVAQQKEVAGLQTLTPEERKRLVNRLIGIEQVEYALKLADEERKARAAQLEIARKSPGKSSIIAVAECDTLRQQQEAARAEEQAYDTAVTESQRRYDEAVTAVTDIRKRINVLDGQRRTLSAIQTTCASLETALANAQKHHIQTTNASQELQAAQGVLAQTIDVQTRLEQWDRLAVIDQKHTQQVSLRHDLTERLGPLLAERETWQRMLADDDAAMRALQEELSTQEQVRARLEQQELQAKARAERLEQRLETVRKLGPDGACETCGQTFGDTLEKALAHYAVERDATWQEAVQMDQQFAALIEKEAALKRGISERERVRDEHRKRLQEFDEVPGEIAGVQRTLEAVTAFLEACSPEELAQSYNTATHDAVRAEVNRRSQAEADVARLQSVAASEPEIRAEVNDLENQLRVLAQQQRQIEAALQEEASLSDALVCAQKQLEAASATRDEQLEKAREASRQLTRISTQLEAAEREVEQARVREQCIVDAESALLVAERTEDLLGQLLLEITSEARPRLAELLDNWARALLGQRFRRIELTDDYRILADNGSGLHQIAHFSGGEQTLLAVMLRVAIAMFCRERAGFDTSFLILDEVFGDQDGEHRAQLVQFLGEVKEHYHQILVINHVEDVTEMFDSIIDVKPTGLNTSTAELRN